MYHYDDRYFECERSRSLKISPHIGWPVHVEVYFLNFRCSMGPQE